MTHSDYVTRLLSIRRAAHIRRASACAFVPERVLGLPLRPITPASWSLLVGTHSAFVSGLVPVEADVRNFVLFHLPEFDSDRPAARAWVRFLARWRLDRALTRPNPNVVGVPSPRMTATRRAGIRALNLQRALAEIKALVDDTFADVPMPDELDAGEPPAYAAALEVQFIDLFAARYAQWPYPTPIRHTPLRILTQLARCIDRAPYFDRAEAKLDSEYLALLNPDAVSPSAL